MFTCVYLTFRVLGVSCQESFVPISNIDHWSYLRSFSQTFQDCTKSTLGFFELTLRFDKCKPDTIWISFPASFMRWNARPAVPKINKCPWLDRTSSILSGPQKLPNASFFLMDLRILYGNFSPKKTVDSLKEISMNQIRWESVGS